MKFSEVFRNKFFFLRDSLNGGIVGHHLEDIYSVMTDINTHQVKGKITSRLSDLLKHAVSTTAFYSSFNESDGINSFPIINKNLVRERKDDFLSTAFKFNEIIPLVTSGSTGTPFKTYHNKNKKYRNSADTIYFAKLGGYELGNKLYYFKIWSDYNRKSYFTQFLQNIVPVDVLNLKANVHHVIEELNKNASPVSFIGYVSAFETICKELHKDNTLSNTLRVNSIITMSESLNDYTKDAVEKYFGCPVLSRYSNIENGIIAQQTMDDHNNFLVNTASYLVEIMDLHKDEVVQNGTPGRIVVTDYYNYAMPLIRYDTGDVGVLGEVEIGGSSRTVLTRIEGRKLDQIYNTKGELISSYIVYRNMWDYTEIEQYQFVQCGEKEYVFKICMPGVFKREAQLVKQFKEYLGDDADFKIEYVHEIPLLNSGKRKKVVNEMKH